MTLSSLYLSMFPQGYTFGKDHLTMKWIEEGMITRDYLNEVRKPDEYFGELVVTKIITPVAENCVLNLDDEEESCQWQVNPSKLEFLASKAADMGYVFTNTMITSESETISNGNMTRIARRLALHHPHPQLPEMLQQVDLSRTRSLLISGAVQRTAIHLDRFAYLVVLDLHGWENLKNEDMLFICKMFMLTYLSIRKTGISELPPQIKELRHLHILDVSHTHIIELPTEVWELSYLRMLNLRGTPISQLPDQIGWLEHLTTLLIGGNETVRTKLPYNSIMSLSLRTLATVDLSECPANFVEVLGGQFYMEVLAITWSFHQCTDEAYGNALRPSIKKWSNLRSLTIHCGLGCSMEFLGSLHDPPKRLEKFKVTAGRFVSVPQWIKVLEKLAFLQITVCRLVPDDVKILAGLVTLKRLVLGLEFIPEEEIMIECEGFNELERFSLDCPVPWLTFKKGAMPKLKYLKLKICSGGHANQVSAVPSGLTNLRKIREVEICYSKWCENSSSIKRTVEAVREQLSRYRNPINLFINGDIEIYGLKAAREEAECSSRLMGESADDVEEAGHAEAHRTIRKIQSEIESDDETENHA